MTPQMLAPQEKDESGTNGSRRRRGNLAIALALGAFVILVFIVTIVRLGGHVLDHG